MLDYLERLELIVVSVVRCLDVYVIIIYLLVRVWLYFWVYGFGYKVGFEFFLSIDVFFSVEGRYTCCDLVGYLMGII